MLRLYGTTKNMVDLASGYTCHLSKPNCKFQEIMVELKKEKRNNSSRLKPWIHEFPPSNRVLQRFLIFNKFELSF